MDRDDFLANIRQSLGDLEQAERPQLYRPPPPPSRAEMTALLIRELEAVGGAGYLAGSLADARRQVIEILTEHGARRVIRGDTSVMRELDLDTELRSSDVHLAVAGPAASREELRDAAFEADVGLTSVDFGVAETGTLALLASPGQGRAVSLLPPVHIAVLDSHDIVYELAALFERVAQKGALPSALTFITGPSRTGDIEQTLTIGVHGPGELHLIVID